MTLIKTYLTFNGNCREAMTFYQQCLGGELFVQTIWETPWSGKLPYKMRDYVLQARLAAQKFEILGTDMVGDAGLIRGNGMSIFLECASETEIRKYYNELSRGGCCTQPVEETFWGMLFGSLTDKFGNHWLLNYRRE